MGNKTQKPIPKMCAKPKNSQKKFINKTPRKRAKKEIDWDVWEQEARRRSAWGGYVQTMNNIRTNQEENEYQHAKQKGDSEKVKEIEEKRKDRTPMLYIG